MMKISFPINYSGYVPFLRSILLLVKLDILPLSQLGLYICFIMQADFDSRHPHYRVILRDDKQLADEFGLNQTTIYRARKSFVKAGLLIEETGKTIIPNYYMFELDKVKKLTKLSTGQLQELFAKPQENFAYIEPLIANVQTNQLEKPVQSFNGPSKGSSFTEEDEDWIRNNVHENE